MPKSLHSARFLRAATPPADWLRSHCRSMRVDLSIPRFFASYFIWSTKFQNEKRIFDFRWPEMLENSPSAAPVAQNARWKGNPLHTVRMPFSCVLFLKYLKCKCVYLSLFINYLDNPRKRLNSRQLLSRCIDHRCQPEVAVVFAEIPRLNPPAFDSSFVLLCTIRLSLHSWK